MATARSHIVVSNELFMVYPTQLARLMESYPLPFLDFVVVIDIPNPRLPQFGDRHGC